MAAPMARVLVLRTGQPAALGVLKERAPKGSLLLPSGPYGFPFAACLELARQFHAHEIGVNPDADGLSRAALAQSLRPIALEDRKIIVPRFDWLDESSIALLSDLLQMASLAKSRLQLIGGIPVCAPSPALSMLLRDAHVADEAFDGTRPRALNVNERALLAALRAAPLPLSPQAAMHVSGLRARDFDAALRSLAAAGYADVGTRIGLGTASELVPAGELARFREAALEVCDLPDARISLLHALGVQSAEAGVLAKKALEGGEPELALARFAFVPAAMREPLTYGRALAQSGKHEAALALFDAEHGPALDRARLAFDLCRAGALGQRDAERALRALERLERGRAGEVEAVAARAALLLSAGRAGSALKLLSRLTIAQVQAAPPKVRVSYFLNLSAAWHEKNRPDKVRSFMAQAGKIAVSPQLELAVDRAAFTWGCASATRLAQAAGHALDVEAARVALQASPQARRSLLHALGERPLRAASSMPTGLDGAFALFQRHGATLVAALQDGELRVFPKHAKARPGLCAWLEAQLARLSNSAAALVPLDVPREGFKADCVLVMPALGALGPILAFFAKPADPQPLLLLASARHAVSRWLESGVLSIEDLRAEIDIHTGDTATWPTSPPNLRPSNEPLTSR